MSMNVDELSIHVVLVLTKRKRLKAGFREDVNGLCVSTARIEMVKAVYKTLSAQRTLREDRCSKHQPCPGVLKVDRRMLPFKCSQGRTDLHRDYAALLEPQEN